MIDGLTEDTGDTSLVEAGAAIASLLSDDYLVEDKPAREAPRKPVRPTPKPVEPPPAESEIEGDPEQPPVDDESDEEEQPAPPAAEPRKLRVKVNGEELELPEDEVAKGYSRTEDYTRKTQKHAENVRAFEGEKTAVIAERQRYATQLAQLDEILSAQSNEPDWDKLKEGDPAVFAATYAAWDQQQKQHATVKAERARAEEKVQADRHTAIRTQLQAEATKLVEAIPSWSDPEVAKTEKKELAEYALSRGYTEDDLASVADHRLVLILRDAMRFQKAEKNKPAVEKRIEQAKVMAPGSPAQQQRRDVSELTRRKQALAKTGSLRDAGAAIALLLEDE